MRRIKAVVAVAALAVVLASASCGIPNIDADAAGQTQIEVRAQSLQKQYELFGERYERLGRVLTEAQLHISDGTWHWIANGVLPSPGSTGYDALAGASRENSYYLHASRAVLLPGAAGDRADLQPMLDYVESQGWSAEVSDQGDGTHIARATTGDGMLIAYTVQKNGQYNLSVSTATYWGDYRALQNYISDRVPDTDLVEEAAAGELTPLPEWDAPVVGG